MYFVEKYDVVGCFFFLCSASSVAHAQIHSKPGHYLPRSVNIIRHFFCTVCLIFYYGTWCRSGELFRPWTPRLLNFISFIIATFQFSNCLSTSRRETTCQRQSRKIVFFFWIEEKTRVEVARFHFVFGAESFERVLNNHAKHIYYIIYACRW